MISMLSGTSTATTSGQIYIRTPNAADTANSKGVSGALVFSSGVSSSGASGSISIGTGTAANGEGGDISVNVGTSSTNAGGALTIGAGSTSAQANGGNVGIESGSTTSTDGASTS